MKEFSYSVSQCDEGSSDESSIESVDTRNVKSTYCYAPTRLRMKAPRMILEESLDGYILVLYNEQEKKPKRPWEEPEGVLPSDLPNGWLEFYNGW